MPAQDVVLEDLELLRAVLKEELGQMAGKSLLITGGAGFLGYYLVQTITHFNSSATAGERIAVTVFDNYSRGVPQWLTSLASQGQVAVVKHDVRESLPAAIGEFAYVIHAASIASPAHYRSDPIGTMDANVNGLRNLLELVLAQRRKGRPLDGMLFYSSSEIYGDPDAANIPTPETYRGFVSCTGPRACYDEAKRFGETLCVNFARQHGIPVKIARPFNNYGPGLKLTDGRLIPDFARDLLDGRDIAMLSDGSPTRTFCYAADAIQGYYKILVRGRPGEAYNIGTETPEISVLDLAHKLTGIARTLFDYRGKVVRGRSADSEYLVDNPSRRCPVIKKARDELGYAPQIPLDEGLRRALIWYSGNRDSADQQARRS